MSGSIESLRREIDETDRLLVAHLNERCRRVLEIGRLKRSRGVRIHQSEREKQVVENAVAASMGPLDEENLRAMFAAILETMRRLEAR